MTRTLRPILAAAAVVGLLAACTNGDDADETTDASSSAAVEETVEDLQAAAGEDAEPIPVAQDLPVLATRTTSDGSTPLEIELNGVTVSGEVMTVVFTARNNGDENWQISQFFDDGSAYAPLDAEGTRSEEPGNNLAFTTDGVTVLDGVNNRVHRAAYDTAGSCACDVGLSSRFVGAGEAVVLTTAFAAPPEDVTEVTVQIPGAGSFDGVALSR